jgi:hypothetical protein
VQQYFAQMIQEQPNLAVEVIGTPAGFTIIFGPKKGERFILHTQRKSIRYFKSPSTLFSFLAEVGVENILVSKINLCSEDSYVRKNHSQGHKVRRIQDSPDQSMNV